MSSDVSISPSTSIIANISLDELKKVVDNDYGLVTNLIKKIDGYDDLNFHLIPPVIVKDDAINIDSWSYGYIVKIINWRDSRNVEFFNEYINVLLHLNKEKFTCPCPVMDKKGKYLGYWTSSTRKKQPDENEFDGDTDDLERRHLILVLTYIPGQVLSDFQSDDKIDFLLGRNLSRIHNLLKPFNDKKGLDRPNFQWSLQTTPKVVENSIKFVNDERERTLINRIVDSFRKMLQFNANLLDKGTIHGDFNLGNVLVRKNENQQLEIAAIIDFADMHNSYYFFDIAMTACYISLHNVDRCEDGIALFLLGYDKKFTDPDLNIIKICICTRLCQSILNGLECLASNPDNDYVRNGAPLKYGWTLLKKLDEMTAEQFALVIRQKMEKYDNRF